MDETSVEHDDGDQHILGSDYDRTVKGFLVLMALVFILWAVAVAGMVAYVIFDAATREPLLAIGTVVLFVGTGVLIQFLGWFWEQLEARGHV